MRRHLYSYTPMPLPTPGTMNFAFQPAFSLPPEMVQGAGKIYGNGNGILPYGNGAPFYYVQAQVLDGLNGQPYDGLYQQGLIDMQEYVAQLQAG